MRNAEINTGVFDECQMSKKASSSDESFGINVFKQFRQLAISFREKVQSERLLQILHDIEMIFHIMLRVHNKWRLYRYSSRFLRYNTGKSQLSQITLVTLCQSKAE